MLFIRLLPFNYINFMICWSPFNLRFMCSYEIWGFSWVWVFWREICNGFFLYGCCTHVFYPLIAKNAWFVKNGKLGFMDIGNLGILMNRSSFDLNWFMGCCVCMLVTCLYPIYSNFSHFQKIMVEGLILFFMEFGVLFNWV